MAEAYGPFAGGRLIPRSSPDAGICWTYPWVPYPVDPQRAVSAAAGVPQRQRRRGGCGILRPC